MNAVSHAIKVINIENSEKDFLNGDCFLFHTLLKGFFPEAVPFYDGNHVYSMVYGRLWDCRGLRLYPLEAEPRIYEQAKDWKSNGNGVS